MKVNPRTVDTKPEEGVIISPSTEGAEPKRRLLTPSAALNEFRASLDIWFSYMDIRTRVEAIQMAEDWRPPSPTKRGAR